MCNSSPPPAVFDIFSLFFIKLIIMYTVFLKKFILCGFCILVLLSSLILENSQLLFFKYSLFPFSLLLFLFGTPILYMLGYLILSHTQDILCSVLFFHSFSSKFFYLITLSVFKFTYSNMSSCS